MIKAKRGSFYNWKHIAFLLTLLLLTSTILAACGSTKATLVKEEVVKGEEVMQTTEETKPEEIAPEPATEPVVEAVAEPVEEPAAEPVAESVVEVVPIVYEGIDMESTLPGEEWIDTSFSGIIDTPKLVIFNDTTNKKVIVEDGQEVEFCKEDALAIYVPGSDGSIIKVDEETFCSEEKTSTIGILKRIRTLTWKEGTAVTQNVVKFNGEEMTLTATLIFTE